MKELSLEQPLHRKEDEMAYFERRYQERVRNKLLSKKTAKELS